MSLKGMRNLFKLSLVSAVSIFISAEAFALTVSGQALFDGAPLRGARIYASDGLKSAVTNRQGMYSIEVPNAGTFTLSPMPTNQLLPEPISQTVTVSGVDISGVNFTFRKTSAMRVIFGRIASKSQPIPGVDVQIIGHAAVQTDANGIFVFPEMPAGRYYLYARKDGATFAPPLFEVLLTKYSNRRLALAGFNRLPGETYSTWMTGLWDMSLAVTSTDCQTTETGLGGTGAIYQIKNRVGLRIPKIGLFYGTAGDAVFTAQGRGRKLFCGTAGSVSASFSSEDQGTVSGSFTVSCLLKPPCTLNFAGSITRK